MWRKQKESNGCCTINCPIRENIIYCRGLRYCISGFCYLFWVLGGPDGELGASMRYLNQRYAMPYKECKAILTDIGTEELAHMEMIAAIVYQLTRNLTPEQIKEGGFEAYFVDHTTGIYPQSAAGTPWSAMTFQSKGDPITDLFEDMAAEAACAFAQLGCAGRCTPVSR